jgi:crotonobetainyl-CoA:carnitine CoA-transferase CaiB-like acyl-CoA transferase
MEAVLLTRTTAEWMRAFDDAGVPCGPVYSYAQLFADPQVRHRQMVVTVEDPELGAVPHVRTPVRLSESSVAVRTVAPKLGQHTEDILGMLGHSGDEIARLRRDGVI